VFTESYILVKKLHLEVLGCMIIMLLIVYLIQSFLIKYSKLLMIFMRSIRILKILPKKYTLA